MSKFPFSPSALLYYSSESSDEEEYFTSFDERLKDDEPMKQELKLEKELNILNYIRSLDTASLSPVSVSPKEPLSPTEPLSSTEPLSPIRPLTPIKSSSLVPPVISSSPHEYSKQVLEPIHTSPEGTFCPDDDIIKLNYLSNINVNNMYLLGIIGDGNCLFHCIMKALNYNYQETPDYNYRVNLAMKLRKDIGEYLEKENPFFGESYWLTAGKGQIAIKAFKELIETKSSECDLDNLKEAFQKSSLVGDEVFSLVAEILEVNLFFVKIIKTDRGVELAYTSSAYTSSRNPHIIIFHKGIHFELIGFTNNEGNLQVVFTADDPNYLKLIDRLKVAPEYINYNITDIKNEYIKIIGEYIANIVKQNVIDAQEDSKKKFEEMLNELIITKGYFHPLVTFVLKLQDKIIENAASKILDEVYRAFPRLME